MITSACADNPRCMPHAIRRMPRTPFREAGALSSGGEADVLPTTLQDSVARKMVRRMASGSTKTRLPPYDFKKNVASTSTVALRGNTATPTAVRACRPASPKISTNKSEAPLTTAGTDSNVGAAST